MPSVSSQSPAVTAIPQPSPQVEPCIRGRPVTGAQLQQQAAQLTQQQLQQWHAQQLKAYQQRQLEQQIFVQQQNYMSQQLALSAAPQYEYEELPVMSSTALPFYVPASDVHQALNTQEMLMQQMLQLQMYEAALAQQQQQMKATVSAGAINLIEHQSNDGSVAPASSSSCQLVMSSADELTAIRRASEGQVCTTNTVYIVPSVASQTAMSTQSQSTDVIPAPTVTCTVDSSSQSRLETFKVPLPPDRVRF